MTNARRAGIIVISLWASALSVRAEEPASSVEFFEKRIRPVLVEHCQKCHGDLKGKAPKGGLRVDSRSALLKGGDNGPVVFVGEPEKSRLIEAIRYKNADLQMPPKGKLGDAVISDLVAWVKAGANWPAENGGASTSIAAFDLTKRKRDHWSWQPVSSPTPPRVRNEQWSASAIDRFILAKLEEKVINPAPSVDRQTWIRRVTFDLIGLPPTPSEIDAFVNDSSPTAFDRVVDRLLASPQFGERWARHWLDLVRYAETRGHEFDAIIPNAHQYRDYVIRALNADVPYDRFVKEHIAGDLLKDPRRHATDKFNESILGTGFWFLGEEVHSPVDIRQDQADRFDNRIDVFGKTLLGLTIACARCHDHKFDAISTKDYYALYGIVESSCYRQVRFDTLEQNRKVAEQLAELNRNSSVSVAKALAKAAEPMTRRMAEYLMAARDAIRTGPELADKGAPDTKPDEFAPEFQVKIAEIAQNAKLDAEQLTDWVETILRASRDSSDPFYVWSKFCVDRVLDDSKKFAGTVVTLRSSRPTAIDRQSVIVDYSRCQSHEWLPDDASFGTAPIQPGQLTIEQGRIAFAERAAAVYDHKWDVLANPSKTENDPGAIGKRVRSGRTIRTPSFKIATNRVHYLVKGAGTAYAAVDGHTSIQGPLHGQLVIDFPATNGWHWVSHDLTTYQGHIAHIEFTPAANADLAIAMVIQGDRTPTLADRPFIPEVKADSADAFARGYQRTFEQMLAAIDSGKLVSEIDVKLANSLLARLKQKNELKAATVAYVEGREQIAKGIQCSSRLAPAIWEGTGVDEHVFIRGSPKGIGERVPRRLLEALSGTNPLTKGLGSGRLELADRITDPVLNPYIARVFVNRVWHHLFGRGIVVSVDNFGVLGEKPTHPELLDYLAAHFVNDGWSLKRLIRELALSSTYRMSSRGDAESDAVDPQNLLLHRMRLRRLEGEAIRDSMLAVSGRLDTTQFGQPIPIHLTPFLDGRGKPSTSGPIDGNGRRSIYLAVRRNFLNPMLLAFDTPIPFSTVGRRQVSNVPAQALILMNDQFVQEQAMNWAKIVLAKSEIDDDRIRGMYLSAFGRAPTEDEIEACTQFLREQAARYGPIDKVKPWADLAHTLFNVKEFIFVD